SKSTLESHNIRCQKRVVISKILEAPTVFLGLSFLKLLKVSSASTLSVPKKLTTILNLYCCAASSRAFHAEIFRIAGPDNPQCVISIGPDSSIFRLGIDTSAWGKLVPIKSFKVSFLMLKVKSDGTGSTILCPRFFISFSDLGELPVV